MKAKIDARAIRIEIARDALESVFEECDQHDRDETGGRMIGHFAEGRGTLVVRANGVIEPGPRARRSSTSFFQDGDYQTEVFRRLEAQDPAIEHLGNWHTHHVNGYPTLSAGDIATYRRIVNHKLHNLDFFYALLVTRRHEGRVGLDRYAVRHYVLFRGDGSVHEVESADVQITDEPSVWPKSGQELGGGPSSNGTKSDGARGTVVTRAHDQAILGILCPSLEPRLSARTGTFFWKGAIQLVDGSNAEVRVVETEDDDGLVYYPMVSPASEEVAELCETSFKSASEAVRALELRMNREVYESAIMREG